ncbi:ribonuclease H-like domain-containing protein [Tanacetum coccineum]
MLFPLPILGTSCPLLADKDELHKSLSHWISDSENENETESKSGQRKPSNAKVEFVKSYEHVKSPREFVKKVENNKQAKYPRKNSQNSRGPILQIKKKLMEDLLPLEELKFNLFSVSQICDKKNSVLFTDTECVVLSPDFKLTDESHVVLKVPRKDSMYSVDLKNVGIKREFSVAKTSQQNRVAERKNRTLIEAARTMLAGLKLPTTFCAEAVNTACYVQKRCPVTILNTIDHLGSRPNWLFDIDTLTKSMNYKPVVVRNQSSVNAGTKACDDAGKEEKKDAEDSKNKDSEVPSTEEPRVNQEKDENVNNTNNINTVCSTVNTTSINDNAVDKNIVYGCEDDPNMPNLEEIVYSNDDEDFSATEDQPQRLSELSVCMFSITSRAQEEVTLVDETQGRNDEEMLFDVNNDLQGEEVVVEKEVVEKEVSTANLVTTAGEVDTTASVEILDELTLAQTLMGNKSAKPKVVTTATTTVTPVSTRPKAKGVVMQEPSETTTTSPSQPLQLPQAKEKGKAKMVEPEKPLKKKDKILFDQ